MLEKRNARSGFNMESFEQVQYVDEIDNEKGGYGLSQVDVYSFILIEI